MSLPFPLGCHYRNTQAWEDVSVLRKFERIKESGVFDYTDWLPRPELLETRKNRGLALEHSGGFTRLPAPSLKGAGRR